LRIPDRTAYLGLIVSHKDEGGVLIDWSRKRRMYQTLCSWR
jgi:hypothetical protein